MRGLCTIRAIQAHLFVQEKNCVVCTEASTGHAVYVPSVIMTSPRMNVDVIMPTPSSPPACPHDVCVFTFANTDKTVMKKRIVFTEERIRRADSFCTDLYHALQEEAAGRAVIVYMDESYCHQQHTPPKVWHEEDAPEDSQAERGRSKGSLTIILHALTKDGWLFVPDADGKPPAPGEWQSGECLNWFVVLDWSGKGLGM